MGSILAEAAGTYHSQPINYPFCTDEYGEVQIRSKNIKLGNPLLEPLRNMIYMQNHVRHFIRFELPSNSKNNWVIFEWENSRLQSFACDNLYNTHYCLSLGEHSLKDVSRAVRIASDGMRGSMIDESNIWVEKIAWYLGKDITVPKNCGCVKSW